MSHIMSLDLFLFVVIFAVGFFVGDAVACWRIRRLAEQIMSGEVTIAELEGTENTDKAEPIAITVETNQGLLYAFDDKDNFICQGKTLTELAALALKYKNISFARVKHGEDTVYFVKGLVSPTNAANT